MEKLRIGICDDEAADLVQMVSLMQAYDPDESFRVTTFFRAGELLEETRMHPFDIVLLDIEMEPPTGFEAAQKLISLPNPPTILFATKSSAYALKGYGVAVRYLQKPVSREAFFEAMDAAVAEAAAHRLTFDVDGTTFTIPSGMYALEIFGHYSMVHTQSTTYRMRSTLKELTATLPRSFFVSPHKSYVVNLEHIQAASATEITMDTGKKSPSAEKGSRSLIRCFTVFLGGSYAYCFGSSQCCYRPVYITFISPRNVLEPRCFCMEALVGLWRILGYTGVAVFCPKCIFYPITFICHRVFCTAKILYEAKILQAIYASFAFLALNALTELIVMSLLSFAGMDAQKMMFYSSARILYVTTVHIFNLIMVLLVLTLTKRKRSAITAPFLLALSPGCIIDIILGISFCSIVQSTGEDVPVVFLLSALGLLYVNVLIVFYAEQAKASSDRQRKMELAEQHYAMQEQYYAELRSEQEETRAMFHDINKCMLAMRALVDESNSEEAGRMQAEAQSLFDSLGKVVDVGNPIISVILNEYREAAEEGEIPFDFDVSVPQKLGITAIDAYVLLGNTLDNAIEACTALPAENRYIRLQMRMFHNILYYRLENPYAAGYLSRKKGKNHGYGLQNVKRCVEKHHGDMSVTTENGVFTVSLRLTQSVETVQATENSSYIKA